MNTADALNFRDVSTNDDVNILFAQLLTDSEENSEALRHGGLLARRVTNIDRGHKRHTDWLFKNYFSDAPIYTERMFKRQYGTSKQILVFVSGAVESVDSYFQQSKDCTGKKRLTTLPKVIAAMRIMVYGFSADFLDKMLMIAESTAL